jgi:hypothetical protein
MLALGSGVPSVVVIRPVRVDGCWADSHAGVSRSAASTPNHPTLVSELASDVPYLVFIIVLLRVATREL